MNFEIVAILGQQRGPVFALRNRRGLVERRLGLLIRHFQEQQKRQLLDVVAVGQAVVPQDVAVVPKLLDKGGGVANAGVTAGVGEAPRILVARLTSTGWPIRADDWIGLVCNLSSLWRICRSRLRTF